MGTACRDQIAPCRAIALKRVTATQIFLTERAQALRSIAEPGVEGGGALIRSALPAPLRETLEPALRQIESLQSTRTA
jgi:hypothetical protein